MAAQLAALAQSAVRQARLQELSQAGWLLQGPQRPVQLETVPAVLERADELLVRQCQRLMCLAVQTVQQPGLCWLPLAAQQALTLAVTSLTLALLHQQAAGCLPAALPC